MSDKKTTLKFVLAASGDLRHSANQMCWGTQADMEKLLSKAFEFKGISLKRAHAYDEVKTHGFIDSQRMGIEVFNSINPDSCVIAAESLWQYRHYVLAGLITHKGTIPTVANWSGQWPGLSFNLRSRPSGAFCKWLCRGKQRETATMFFPLVGGTLKGISKPGHTVK